MFPLLQSLSVCVNTTGWCEISLNQGHSVSDADLSILMRNISISCCICIWCIATTPILSSNAD